MNSLVSFTLETGHNRHLNAQLTAKLFVSLRKTICHVYAFELSLCQDSNENSEKKKNI
jgi:hypothetical protein